MDYTSVGISSLILVSEIRTLIIIVFVLFLNCLGINLIKGAHDIYNETSKTLFVFLITQLNSSGSL